MSGYGSGNRKKARESALTFRGTDVVDVLERVGREIGLPVSIRVDQGTEFVSRDLDLWERVLRRLRC